MTLNGKKDGRAIGVIGLDCHAILLDRDDDAARPGIDRRPPPFRASVAVGTQPARLAREVDEPLVGSHGSRSRRVAGDDVRQPS